MISSEVQRTLVKSPPELWAELSDPAALARHLGELGQIRIVRTEPERTVEWTAEDTTGTVSIKPSGWGTNVKLTVTRGIAEPTAEAEPQAEADPKGEAGREVAAAVEPEPEATAVEPERDTSAVEPVAAEAQPRPRRGFFARLFGRRRAAAVAVADPQQADAGGPAGSPASELHEPAGSPTPERSPERPDAFAAVREALEPQSVAASHPFAALPPAPAPAPAPDAGRCEALDLSAELMAAEEVAAEEVTAVLTAVLDRLGAAHHRPFSRA